MKINFKLIMEMPPPNPNGPLPMKPSAAPSNHALGQAGQRPVGDLRAYYRNPRRGDVAAIAASLAASGQYRPLVVNLGTQTGRPLEVLAGNHTLRAAGELGWDEVSTWEIDVDDAAAARIVAADNRTSDLGSYNEQALADLLSDLDGLDGTGYTDQDLQDLLKATTPAPEKQAPEEFPSYDEDTISTDHECPRCGYQWSGATA